MIARIGSLSAFAGIVLVAPLLHGATISWGTATTASSDSDVLSSGLIKQALNFGASSGTTTVNGVDFTDIAEFSYGTSMGSGVGYVTLGDDGYVDHGGLAAYDVFGSSEAPFSSLSASYQSILQSGGYRETSTSSNLLFTINGLEVGKSYRVQFWSNDARGQSRSTTFSAGNTVIISQSTSGLDGGPGEFVTGYFTADATTQDILLTATTPSSVSLVSAYTLAEASPVPEPSTYAAFAGAVALGFGFYRRRRKNSGAAE